MITIQENFKPEYKSEKPTRVIPLGSSRGVYIPSILAQSYILDKKIIYPAIVNHNEKLKICYFFKKPANFDEKSYNIYKLKSKELTRTYLPVPKYLWPLLGNSNKKPLINFSFGILNRELVIILERI